MLEPKLKSLPLMKRWGLGGMGRQLVMPGGGENKIRSALILIMDLILNCNYYIIYYVLQSCMNCVLEKRRKVLFLKQLHLVRNLAGEVPYQVMLSWKRTFHHESEVLFLQLFSWSTNDLLTSSAYPMIMHTHHTTDDLVARLQPSLVARLQPSTTHTNTSSNKCQPGLPLPTGGGRDLLRHSGETGSHVPDTLQ